MIIILAETDASPKKKAEQQVPKKKKVEPSESVSDSSESKIPAPREQLWQYDRVTNVISSAGCSLPNALVASGCDRVFVSSRTHLTTQWEWKAAAQAIVCPALNKVMDIDRSVDGRDTIVWRQNGKANQRWCLVPSHLSGAED